jgi:tetratricopeptide (TPR) repeat protein
MFFWWIRGHVAEGLQWYEQVLNLRPLSPAAESRALLGAAVMWYAQGGLERARAALTRAYTLAEAGADLHIAVRAAELSARVEWGLGDLEAARDWFTRAIEGFQALAIPWGTGNALLGISGISERRS